MAAANIARFRNLQPVQGSADAFAQVSEVTGIDPVSGRAWMLRAMDVSFPPDNTLAAVSADFSIHWSLTRDSKAAVAGLDDSDCIEAGGIYGSLTTSGQILLPSVYHHTFEEGIIVVEPMLYFQIDSNATGLTLSPDVRLYYDEVKLSEVDILRMLTQG